MKKLLSILLSVVIVLGILTPAAAAGSEDYIPIIQYTVGENTYSAELTSIGTYSPVSSYANSALYLASLPYGATITSYSITGTGYSVTNVFYGTNTLATTSDLISSYYLNGAQFIGTNLGTSTLYYKYVVAKLDDSSTTISKIPTATDLEGYCVRFTIKNSSGTAITAPAVIIQISTSEPTDSVSTTELSAQVDRVTGDNASNFYQSDDRWNGTDSSTDGFWSDMLPILTTAQSYISTPPASQTTVDTVTANLTAAIDALISTSNVNATELYETIQTAAAKTESLYTVESWAALESAISAAWDTLDSLYYQTGDTIPDGKSVGDPTDINDSSNDTTTAALVSAEAAITTAVDNLLLSSQYEEAEDTIEATHAVLPELISLIEGSNLSEDDYTAESWSSLQTALTAAAGYTVPKLTGYYADKTTASSYADAFSKLYTAYYWGLTPTDDITVTLRSMDPNSARAGKTTAVAGYSGNMTLSGDYSLGAALTKAGITVGSNSAKVYINGVFVDGRYVSDSNEAAEYGAMTDILLHPGDNVTVVWNVVPESEQSPRVEYIQASFSQYVDSLKVAQFSETDGLEAEAGKAFTLTVEEAAAALGDYPSDYAAADNMTLYISAISDDGTGNMTTTTKLQADGEDIVTDSNGQAQLTIYAEGWYLIAAYDLEDDTLGDQPQYGDLTVTNGTYHSVNSGAAIWVHVTDSSDPASVKAELKTALDEVYAAYDKSYFREADWESIDSAYNTAVSGITDADTIAAAYSAQQTGIVAIKEIQDSMLSDNTARLSAFRDRLNRLPDDSSLLTQSVQYLVTSLIECYNAMSDYQLGQMTTAELNKYEQIVAANAAGLPDAVSYSLSLAVEADSDTSAAAIADMLGYLQDNNTNKDNPNSQDIATLSGNADLWKINQFYTYARSAAGSMSDETLGVTAANPDSEVNLAYDVGFYAYSLVRDDSDNTISGDGWTISDDDFTLSDYLSSDDSYDYYDVLTNMTVKIDGVAYEIKSIAFTGIDSGDVTYDRSELIDKTTYQGKSADNVNVYFEDSVLSFIMPYSDVTVTFTWGPVTSDTELLEAKDAAKSAIETAYAAYDLTKYDDSGKAALLLAKETGITAVDAATTADGVTSARRTALAAMASVSKADSGTGSETSDLPDFGSVIGQVYITVENNTFSGGDFTGTLLSGWYDLCEEDTMMTAVLKALALNGYGWTGTGGSDGNVDDYTISYLASITQGSKSLAEFDGESGSGWMGMLNDWFVNEGFNQSTSAGWDLENGDQIDIVYTQNLGADVGSDWSSSDTSLDALTFSSGTLMPNFTSDTASYGLILNSASANLTVTPTAANKNYLVKTFLNKYNTDSAYYKRTETIPVKAGDTLYIGCGDYSWPSMNKQSSDAISYTGTKYTIKVYSSMAGFASDLIAALPAVSKITLSTYTSYQDEIEYARSVYGGLTTSQKTEITNLSILTAAEEKLEFYEEIANVKALLSAIPKSSTITTSNMKTIAAQVLAAEAAYEALSDEQKLYITVAVVTNYNAAITKLTELGAFTENTAPSTITGSDEEKEKSGSAVTLTPTVTASNGTAAVTLSSSDLTDAITEAAENSSTSIVITPDITGTATKVTVTLPKTSVSSIASETDANLTVDTPVGSVTIPNDALSSIASQASGSTVTISLDTVETSSLSEAQQAAVGGNTVYDISVLSGGSNISSFGGSSITISLPYTLANGESADGVVVWYLNDAGELEQMTCTYDNTTGLATFTTAHLSYYLVGYDASAVWTNPFTDVSESDWFYDAVKYVSENSLMSGTTTTTFAPNNNMTRAMLVTVLYRLDGQPSVTGTNSFTDVQSGLWYTNAVVWASENNIISGYGGDLFGTNDSVTREQMVSILYNYAKYKSYDVTKTTELSAYTDASNVSSWAVSAMQWAVVNGIITGTTPTTLSPSGSATRAQVATVLMQFCKNILE